MAITAKRRADLPRGSYVYGPKSRVGGKGRKAYPIDTPKRARNALARAAQKNTAGSYSTVAKAVRAKYGNRIASVGPTRGTTSRPGYAKRTRSTSSSTPTRRRSSGGTLRTLRRR
jgi:hypothetical protein